MVEVKAQRVIQNRIVKIIGGVGSEEALKVKIAEFEATHDMNSLTSSQRKYYNKLVGYYSNTRSNIDTRLEMPGIKKPY